MSFDKCINANLPHPHLFRNNRRCASFVRTKSIIYTYEMLHQNDIGFRCLKYVPQKAHSNVKASKPGFLSITQLKMDSVLRRDGNAYWDDLDNLDDVRSALYNTQVNILK